MSDKVLEPIISRATRLTQLILGKGPSSVPDRHLIHVDALLDVLVTLYEECSGMQVKRDDHIATFINKFQKILKEVRGLRVSIADFEVKKVIGRGNFGEVKLVREKATSDVYAMKVLRKANTLSHQCLVFFEEERNIMSKSTSPWITKLHFAFQDSQHLYLIMEFHSGGDMLSLLERNDCFSESTAQFYLAELVLAIHAVHSMGYAHRDIKPDNILIDRTGHIKLADFGSASKLNAAKLVTNNVPVGTPDYVSPEVLASNNDMKTAKNGYGVECDWWSLGIVAYEMMVGSTPFADDKLLVVYNNIMNFKKSLKIPDDISQPFKNLVRGLLNDASIRLDHKQLLSHEAFADVNWNDIRQTAPPFVPNVVSQDDTSNFDDFENDVRPTLDSFHPKNAFSGKNLPFLGFTYTAPCESPHPKSSSYDSPSKASDADLVQKKKALAELQGKIVELTSDRDSRIEEIKKMKISFEKREDVYEKEICRLEDIIIPLQQNKKELVRLLRLEREDRILTDKKARQIMKCMKSRRRSGSHHISLQEDVHECNGHIPVLQLLDDALLTVDTSRDENRAFVEAVHHAKSLSPYASRQQMNIPGELAVDSEEESSSLRKQLQSMQDKSEESSAQVESLTNAISMLEKRLHETEQEYRNSLVSSAKDSKLASIVSKLEKDIVLKQSSIDELQRQSLEAKATQEKLNAKLQEKEDALCLSNLLNKELEAILKDLRADQSTLKEESKILRQTVDDVETKLKCLQENVTLSTDESDFISANSSMQDKLESQTQLTESQEKNKILNEKIRELEATIAELESQGSDRTEATIFKRQPQRARTVEDVKAKLQACYEKGELSSDTDSTITAGSPMKQKPESPTLQAKLQDENKTLKEKIRQLETGISELKFKESDHANVTIFEKQLQEKENALSEVKLDLKIVTREKKRAEDLMSSFRDSNREFREKLSNAEKLLEEKTKSVNLLEEKVKKLEDQMTWKKDEINERIKGFEIEKAKLEERTKAMQHICESQKDIGQIYVKSQDHHEETTKENEKLKYQVNSLNKEKLQIASEMDDLKTQLTQRQQDCTKQEEIIQSLKTTCFDLDELLKEEDIINDANEKEIKALKSENKMLLQQSKKLEAEKKVISAVHLQEKQAREHLEQQLEDLEVEMENQLSVHSTEVLNLQDQVEYQRKVYLDLEQQVDEAGVHLARSEHDAKSIERKNVHLQNELILLKNECADHITQICSLKSSNVKLTESLKDAADEKQEIAGFVQELENKIETNEAEYNHEKLKLQETISQQVKLIYFLQTMTESMEKKKKPISVHRIFGRKENSGLEQERTKSRRLQDQLSQARAENMTLRNEMHKIVPRTPVLERSIASVPISPASRALHSALTSPSTTGNYPALVTNEAANKYVKVQGMKHHIPHRFNEITCMRGFKCAACLDSIHFGRAGAKCNECGVICHPKCSTSLPSTCGLPSGFMQHFKSTFHNSSSTASASTNEPKLEGWIKIPKSNKQGWDRRYIRIVGSSLYLCNDSESFDVTDAMEVLDFASNNGEVIVLSAVSATELANSATSDLPFVLKVEYRSFTTCWPSKSFYFMCQSFADKQMWVENLEALAAKHNAMGEGNLGNKLAGESVFTLKGDKVLDVHCIFLLEDDVVLLGAMEGLYVVPFSKNSSGLMSKLDGIDNVYQICCVKDISMLVFISGKQRNLRTIRLDALQACILERRSLSLEKISDSQDCHLFAVQDMSTGGAPHLCAAAANTVTLFIWNSNIGEFGKRKMIETSELCCCIHFTPSSVIFGCDKFYELDLKTCATEEFLDCTDASLAGVIYGVTQLKSFPISIFHVSAVSQTEEYLVCFHEFGVFVDGFGQRTRSEDMKWSRLPLAFAYQMPYLFVTHFNSLEIIEILPHGEDSKSIRAVMGISNPQYLGPAFGNGSIYVSSSRDQFLEIFCVDGKSSQRRLIEADSESTTRSSSSESKGSVGEVAEDLDFSFSTSILQDLETPSCDNLSLSSDFTISTT